MASVPPASAPAEEHEQPAVDAPVPSPDPEEVPQSDIRLADEDESARGPVLDLTDATRPMVIDLVRPEVTPPDVPVDEERRAERLDAVGLLAARPWQLGVKRLIDIVGSLTVLIRVIAADAGDRDGCPIHVSRAGDLRATQVPGRVDIRSPCTSSGRWSATRTISDTFTRIAIATRSAPSSRFPTTPAITPCREAHPTVEPRRAAATDERPTRRHEPRRPPPRAPEEFALCSPDVRQRTLVAPGLTCIWQVSGRSDVDFLRWVDMDLEYIRTWTLRLDLLPPDPHHPRRHPR